jgi:adenylate kinase family enzyme
LLPSKTHVRSGPDNGSQSDIVESTLGAKNRHKRFRQPTSAGRAVAEALAIPHHDTDDFFWLPMVPLYRQKRAIEDRLRLMREMFLNRSDWVLSGSLDDWGESIVPFFDLVVFVEVPVDICLKRLRDRETRHFGPDAVTAGGWRHRETEEFIEWVSHYEDGSREGRNLVRHLAWLDTLTCPVLRIDGTRPIPDLVCDVI